MSLFMYFFWSNSQIAFILFYFFITFLFSYLLFKIFLNKQQAIIVSLFSTINPISLHFLSLLWICLVYPSIFIFIYSFLKYFKTGRYCFLLLNIISISLLIQYQRVTLIFIVWMLILWGFFYRSILNYINFSKTKFFTYSITFVLFFWWLFIFYVNNIFFSWDIWQYNYVKSNSNFAETYYNNLWWSNNLIRELFFTDIASNYIRYYWPFNVIFIMIIWLILSKKNIKNIKLKIAALIFLLVWITIKISNFIFSTDIFSLFTYKIFPSFAWNVHWWNIFLIFSPILGLIYILKTKNGISKKLCSVLLHYFLYSLILILLQIKRFHYFKINIYQENTLK